MEDHKQGFKNASQQSQRTLKERHMELKCIKVLSVFFKRQVKILTNFRLG